MEKEFMGAFREIRRANSGKITSINRYMLLKYKQLILKRFKSISIKKK